jgi:hypothetical protein
VTISAAEAKAQAAAKQDSVLSLLRGETPPPLVLEAAQAQAPLPLALGPARDQTAPTGSPPSDKPGAGGGGDRLHEVVLAATKASKKQNDLNVMTSDPMFQFFFLTAQSHKINNPLLAEIPFSAHDCIDLFRRATEKDSIDFNRWPQWLLSQLTRISMSVGLGGLHGHGGRGGGQNGLQHVLVAKDKRALQAGDTFTTYHKGRLGWASKTQLLRLSDDLLSLEIREVKPESVVVSLADFDTIVDATERWKVRTLTPTSS